jgi:hypothetical protein
MQLAQEDGIAIWKNKNIRGFAALSYVATNPLSDFYLETWIHAQITHGEKGPLNASLSHRYRLR